MNKLTKEQIGRFDRAVLDYLRAFSTEMDDPNHEGVWRPGSREQTVRSIANCISYGWHGGWHGIDKPADTYGLDRSLFTEARVRQALGRLMDEARNLRVEVERVGTGHRVRYRYITREMERARDAERALRQIDAQQIERAANVLSKLGIQAIADWKNGKQRLMLDGENAQLLLDRCLPHIR